ncbi:MAG: ATPase, partial [Clostridia bacterium]|nr:ATPase [Clostridia bacterium]
DPKVRAEYEARQEALRMEASIKQYGYEQGEKAGIKRGRQEGEKFGIEKEKIQIAKKMKENKMDLKQISEITGLSIEEIKKL